MARLFFELVAALAASASAALLCQCVRRPTDLWPRPTAEVRETQSRASICTGRVSVVDRGGWLQDEVSKSSARNEFFYSYPKSVVSVGDY